MAITQFRDAFYSWYAQYLKDRGLQFTRAGSKAVLGGKHAINPKTGYWIDPNYSGSKPIRWLVHIDPFSNPIKASIPDGHLANRLGHSNTAQGDKAGIAIRIIPVFAQGDGERIGAAVLGHRTVDDQLQMDDSQRRQFMPSAFGFRERRLLWPRHQHHGGGVTLGKLSHGVSVLVPLFRQAGKRA